MNALHRRLHSYANQYITPSYQAQQESYLSTPVWKPSADSRAYSEQRKSARRAIHLAASAAAHIIKRQSPVASVILDGLGLMTSDNLLDAAKSAVSAADTICNMIVLDVKSRENHAGSRRREFPKTCISFMTHKKKTRNFCNASVVLITFN